MDYTNLSPEQDINENGLLFDLGSLYAYLQRVSDSRKAKGKVYSLGLLLVLMVLAKLGGEDRPSGIADWVGHWIEALYKTQILAKKRTP